MMILIFNGRNRVTQPFGGAHTGIDIVGDDDRNVLAACSGAVSRTQLWDGVTLTKMQSYGNLVIVRGEDGRYYYYAHLSSIAVSVGQQVKAGDKLGVMGSTGNSTGPHTHFEIRAADNKTHCNPADYLGIPNQRGSYTLPKQGWKKESGSWYYYDSGEQLRSKWLKYSGFWYWLDEDGKMATGLQQIGGRLYCLNPAEGQGIPEGACLITDSSGAIV